MAPEPERLIAGRYRLDAVIGRGGMGAVWRARDEALDRDVAVKEIIWPPQVDPAERETTRRRAVREAQMAARLHHPNVVAIYDIIEEDDRALIVMELVPDRSLRDAILEDGPLSPGDAARAGLGVLAALRAAHQAGVVHRDVKPANILLGRAGRIVLTDFGIAKAADSPALTASGVLLGSPSYIAPEHAMGGPAGPAADLWALGASLYAAIEGRPPFERDSVLASVTAVVADEPDPPAHAGPLWPVISGLLRKDPGARLSTAEAEQMLQRVAREDDLTAAPAQTQPAQTQPAQTQPAHAQAAQGQPPRAQARPGGPRRFRTDLAALVAVMAVAVIAAGIVVASGRPHGGQAALRAGSTPRATAASASASSAAAPGGTGQARPGGSSGPGGSSEPAGSGSGALPAGYYLFTNSTGFSIGVPRGWQISHVGHYVYIRDPANSGIYLLIDQSDQPKSDPLADWQQQAASRQGSYPEYHLILLRAVRYPQAEKAADWEFSYDDHGAMVRVLNRNVLANSRHAYALYWSTPVSGWNGSYHYFQVFAATFRPASTSQAD